MSIKLRYLRQHRFFHFILIFILFCSITETNAQCAGEDTSVTICDIQNPANSNVNLFNLLGGNPTTGGVWIDNSKPLEESIFNGFLNPQAIHNSGIYSYTYVQDPSACTDNEATITLKIGPYVGVPSPNVSTCEDEELFNLFLAFDGTKLPPQQNGIWTANSNPVSLSGNTIKPNELGIGTYLYTYTIPALDTCPEQSATISVSIFEKPDSGSPSNLVLCSTDDLTLYRNLNLNDRLINEDIGGRWTDVSGTNTNQLTSSIDNRIDVENIYNTFGAGTYNFVYTVLSTNPICDNSQSTVQIIIEDPLDFTGSTLVVNSDICENEIPTATYRATLRKGPQAIPAGNYIVTYSIFDGTTTRLFSTIDAFVNGNFVFDVDEDYLQAVGNYTFTITNIIRTASYGACTNILGIISDVLTISPMPKINTATVKIDPICKGLDAAVEISGNTNLTNGNYRIIYNLSGDNTVANQQLDFTATNGVALFAIPTNLIPNVGVNTIFRITNITNLTTGCTNSSTLSKAFVVKPLTDLSALTIAINNVCQNQPVTVNLSGLGVLTNITLNYNLTGVNTATNQTVILPVTAGNTSFVIPAPSLVNTGITSLVINDVIDNGGGCGSSITIGAKSFTIHPFPNNPIVNDQSFCENENATIADLVPNGSQYQWFNSATSTTALASNTVLVSGNYFVKEVNAVTGCESGKSQVAVVVNEVQAPILDTDGQNFCSFDNPTLQNLSDRTTIISGTITWFDAATDGNQLDSTVLLVDGATYYGYNLSNDSDCFSDVLEVTVSLSNCEETAEFFIPDGFSPNYDTVNDTFRIPDIEFIYPNYTLEIYNRYGNLMFKGNKTKPYWDGKNSDAKIAIDGFAPNGVYFYVINFNKGNKSPKQGRLYLNR